MIQTKQSNSQKRSSQLRTEPFSIGPIQYHTHNRSDSPAVSAQNIDGLDTFIKLAAPVSSYGGKVSSVGAALLLPTGWTSAFNGGTNVYTVTHNLNNASYAVIIQPQNYGGGTAPSDINVISTGINSFTLHFADTAGSTVTTDFWFTLTIV